MMDVCVDYDLELGLHDASAIKLPGGVVFSKETPQCGTPFSQASTAPSTPFGFHMPDPTFHNKGGKDVRSFSFNNSMGDFKLDSDIGNWAEQHIEIEQSVVELSSDLGQWATKHAQIENTVLEMKSELGDWAQKLVEVEKSLQSDLGRWALENEEAERKIRTLQSELGQWAQKVVEAENALVSFGCRPLQSELGRRMQRIVEAEVWLQQQWPQESTFLVDNSTLEGGTNGLAWRKSKRVEDREVDVAGPTWGEEVEGVDEGDGWLKVGELYLPMILEGMCVLSPNPDSLAIDMNACDECSEDDEAYLDGAALTPDGRVVDLDGGSPIFFSCDPTLSSSHSCKVVTINAAKATKAAREAQAAEDVEAKAACSIDAAGIVRGASALAPSAPAMDSATRLKLFHLKRSSRQVHTIAPKPVLCTDASGKACVFLYLSQKLRAKRLQEKRAQAARQYKGPATVVSIDANGVVQHNDE